MNVVTELFCVLRVLVCGIRRLRRLSYFVIFFARFFLGIHNESVYLRGLLEGCLQYAVSYI